MNESRGPAMTELGPIAAVVPPQAVTRGRARSRFYVGMTGVLFLIVLLGFSRTLYLRPFFDVPEIPAYVLLHGVVLTAWFVSVLLQATLVAAHRTDIHRRLGWMGVGLGIGTFIFSVAMTMMFVPRRYALGEALPSLAATFWGDVAALLSFAVFLSGAVARRRQPDKHRRLMVLAAISVVPPAVSRILRWPIFEGINGSLWALVSLTLLVGAVAMHDVRVNRRIHHVTLLGGLFLLGSRAFARYVLATSGFGLAVVRRLAEQ